MKFGSVQRFYQRFLPVVFCCLPIGFFVVGCSSSTPEPDPTPVPARVNVRATQGALLIPVKYRVTGITGKLTGTYTGADGSPKPIEAKAGEMVWEVSQQMAVDTMRKSSMTISAATDTGTNITVEIYADGQLRGSRNGTNPELTVIKH